MATYATQIYPEIPAALAVMTAVSVLSGPLDRRRLGVVTLAIVALPWLSIKYAPVAVCLAAITLWRLRDRRTLNMGVVASLVVAGIVYLLAHRAIYGGWTAYASGDYFSQTGEFSVVGSTPNYLGRSRRLVGLLVDDGFGIAAWMVGWLALPFALGLLIRRRPANAMLLMLPLATGWLTATFVAATMHGWWWPGRQLVVVLPLGVIAIAIAADSSATLRRFLVISAVLGVSTWLWTTVEAITPTAGSRGRLRRDSEPVDAAVAPCPARWPNTDHGGRHPHCRLDGDGRRACRRRMEAARQRPQYCPTRFRQVRSP